MPSDPTQHGRAEQLIAQLALAPHPEGGWYRRVHRSAHAVRLAADAPADTPRAACTTIFYLLRAGELSRWHRIDGDEIWHYHEGAPLTLWRADSALDGVEALTLGPVAPHGMPVQVVPGGSWQAARSTGDYTLAGCTVAPGFEFERFVLLADDATARQTLQRRHAALALLL